jgi:hypothetical protein
MAFGFRFHSFDKGVSKNDVRRRGYGRKEGRISVLSWLSLAFWALIARIALREGRVVVVTGDADSGVEVVLGLLPGKDIEPPDDEAKAEGLTVFDTVPRGGHFKLLNPKNLIEGQFRDLLTRLADDERFFTVASNNAEWLKKEMRFYSRQPGSRPVFWLTLV